MLNGVRDRLTYANVMVTLLAFVVLGGGAYALEGRNTVDAGDLKKNAVKPPEIAKNAVKKAEIAKNSVGTGEVKDASLLGEDFAPGELPQGPQGPPGTPGQNTSAPAGAVSFFNRPACPSGWTELTAARGRYIVGIPVGGTLAGTAGTALTDLEDRAVGQHTHGVTDPGHRHFFGIDQGATDTSNQVGEFQDTAEVTIFSDVDQTSTASTGITVNNAGTVAGTNSPYIQLLVCQKG
jgi:hypothetical protein